MGRNITQAKLEPGNLYHIFTRGNNKETIFKESKNHSYFLSLWKRHIAPIADTYAYCLLSNHLHFCIRIKFLEKLPGKYSIGEKPLYRPFSNCFNAYAKAINKQYNRTGSLFEETYKRKKITDEAYFIRLIAYIHANPQHHKICSDFRDYSNSSYRAFISDKPTNLMREEVWDLFGGRNRFIEFHKDHQNWRDIQAREVE